MDLFHRWEAVVRSRTNAFALADLMSGKRWTFGGIQREVESRPRLAEPVVFPRGMEVDLIFETLRGWRDGAIVCPIEKEVPPSGFFEGVPDGIAHAKPAPGSGARERAILFRAGQIEADADQIVRGMWLTPDRPNIGVVSMAHSYGFSSLVLPLLLHGIPLYWCGDTFPGAVARALEEARAATLPAVPVLWRTWFDAGILGDGVSLAISAGAPLSLELERSIYEETGIKVHNFYGASECGGIAFDSSESPRSDASIVGDPLGGVRVTAPGGAFSVESPAVGECCWPPEEGDAMRWSGCFRPGDEGELADGGSLRLLRRRRDLINVAGRKVYPPAVEDVVEAVDGVECCIVFGVESSDAERVDEVAACIRLEKGVDLRAVRQSLRGRLMRYEIPQRWWFWQELAAGNDGGAVDRGTLRARWRDRTPLVSRH